MTKDEFFRRARTDLPGPLAGVRVIEATTTWAGPMCACVLADFGADVIKVELPEGEVARRLPPFLPGAEPGLSFMHTTVNRNKRSLTLDLRQPAGRDLFLRLARSADVVVENFRPGTMAEWGLGYDDVHAVRPDVVYVSISGFGQFGPDRERAGYDPMAQAASGWLSLNGEPGGPPVKAPTFIGDDLGGLHGALAALAALRHRDRTGEGQHVDVALQDALLFQSNGYPMLAALGVDLPRMGSQFVVAAPAGVYRCSDGYVMLGVLLDAHWRVLAGLLGRPELADDPAYATGRLRVTRRPELNALIEAWVGPQRVAEVVETLVAARLPASAVRRYADAAGDPHVRERDMLQSVELENGQRAPLVGPAAKFSRTPVGVRAAAPALGAHTDELLEELGVTPGERARLRERGVI
ncbi:MAG TPA: CoA transferase [Myxococcota bacterium]|nr:CoA transferase [Myxococcota bacterium]